MRDKLTENFYRDEFACKCGCGFDTVDYKLAMFLQFEIREFFDKPVTITSGCRCPKHNRGLGSPNSQHLFGRAADFTVQDVSAALVQERCEDMGIQGLGIYDGWTHIDTRSGHKARWRGH